VAQGGEGGERGEVGGHGARVVVGAGVGVGDVGGQPWGAVGWGVAG